MMTNGMSANVCCMKMVKKCGAFFTPNGITHHSYVPKGVTIPSFGIVLSATLIWHVDCVLVEACKVNTHAWLAAVVPSGQQHSMTKSFFGNLYDFCACGTVFNLLDFLCSPLFFRHLRLRVNVWGVILWLGFCNCLSLR
eukprot:m.242810 g.242810  ORF g.242810 m.242810 type:complete len:139 (+) comp22544_c1_seq18:748-1164(+)